MATDLNDERSSNALDEASPWKSRYPNLLLTLSLFFVLVPPMILRGIHRSLEPYPAILLPSGAHIVNLGVDEILFNRVSLYGKRHSMGEGERIDLGGLLRPIPPYFVGYFLKTMGLTERGKQVTPEEVTIGKRWWRERLLKKGWSPDSIKATKEKMMLNIEHGLVTKGETLYERVYKLD